MNLDPSSSPLAFFAAEVKRLRGNAGMTQEQLANVINYGSSTVAAIETCRLLPSEGFAEKCDKVFGTDEHLSRLQGLVDQTSVLPLVRDLVKVERGADEIRVYEPYQVPALLQIEQYTRAVARANRPMLCDGDIDKAVALRFTRQEILDQSNALPVNYMIKPRLWAIIDQPVLYRMVGGSQVMREQLEHLIEMAVRPNITIQIITSDQGITCAYGRAFVLLITKTEPLIYLEDLGSSRYVRKTDEASQYVMAFDHLRAAALDEEKTLDLIRDAIKND